jgi:hypothetical protein
VACGVGATAELVNCGTAELVNCGTAELVGGTWVACGVGATAELVGGTGVACGVGAVVALGWGGWAQAISVRPSNNRNTLR